MENALTVPDTNYSAIKGESTYTYTPTFRVSVNISFNSYEEAAKYLLDIIKEKNVRSASFDNY